MQQGPDLCSFWLLHGTLDLTRFYIGWTLQPTQAKVTIKDCICIHENIEQWRLFIDMHNLSSFCGCFYILIYIRRFIYIVNDVVLVAVLLL